MRMARQVGRTLLTILNGGELLNRGPECDMSLHQVSNISLKNFFLSSIILYVLLRLLDKALH